ncbi:MAG: hypothetical protein QNI87_10520 [Erythrobacter sp.]|uniref:hypothetical protein n=1 Tax=Erythrobacter sp. TaxID=1042 RepID=UPI00262FA70D|nr:hypothetical protein [Erythrobacter sp.]MDJ0978959.1 hypothetical protein [Erythrobacter sp.]
MRNVTPRWLALTALTLALGACGDSAAPEEAEPIEDGGEAEGDVLGGSISDAMIPLEALRSQSPTFGDAPVNDAPVNEATGEFESAIAAPAAQAPAPTEMQDQPDETLPEETPLPLAPPVTDTPTPTPPDDPPGQGPAQ